ncbi:IS66 family insertion sequence element accessory protein TnpB [Acidithiobacillus ferrooxidans]|uniref:IS66 family insertion sequence element accessory protein TnpB n=1 Tax=Acidithiobacillus ferrooxidans TaxID=920 RepID=UPI0035ABAD3A
MWLSPGSRIWLAAAPVDMRLGFDGLAAKVQGVLAADPFCGHAFVFRNRRGDRLKLLFWDGLGFWLFIAAWIRGDCIGPEPIRVP